MLVNERRYFPPVSVRSRLVLEVASELAGTADWPHKQARLKMRNQETDERVISLFASDCPETISEVASGEVQMAIINPGVVLALALRGTGPFKEPIPLRAITVLASYDQLGFAVTESSGLKSLEDIRDRRFPLKVALRGQRDHSVHLVVNEVLSAVGFSIDDIVAWGGKVHHHPGVRDIPDQIKRVERGEIDAIFDEGIGWANLALEAGMRFLPLEETVLQKLEAMGFRRGTIAKATGPKHFPSCPPMYRPWTSAASPSTPTPTRPTRSSRSFAVPWRHGRTAYRGIPEKAPCHWTACAVIRWRVR